MLALACLAAPSISASEYHASTAADVAKLADKLQPGDTVVFTDGSWQDQALVLRGKGTAEKPITYHAQTPGKVVLAGKSSVLIDGDHLVVAGLYLRDISGTGDGIRITGRNCRLTETAIVDCAVKFYVHLFGRDNRVDHCYLAGKTNDSPTFQVEVDAKPNRHVIDRNHFGHRPPLGRNGGETMRVGYSHQSMSDSQTLVERNLFERCDGEIEIISNKSCGNIYRGNTFVECAGMFTLRHGNRCVVEGNFIFGRHKRGSGGFRVIGEDHVLINNYVEGIERGGFWITSGIPDSPLNGYYRARNVLIAFNTVVDSRGPGIELDAGFGTSKRSLRPENITIFNNLFSLPSGGVLLKGTEGEGFKWAGNFASAEGAREHPGIRLVDPRLERGADGLFRPAAASPVRGAGEGNFPNIKSDIDGQPRTGKFDSGCDQISDAPIANRPLTAADVGPSWLDRKKPTQAPKY